MSDSLVIKESHKLDNYITLLEKEIKVAEKKQHLNNVKSGTRSSDA